MKKVKAWETHFQLYAGFEILLIDVKKENLP